MKRFGRKQWIAVAALVLVILVTGLFTVRTVRRAVYWRLHRDEVIRPWMSIPYIAHSYRIAPHILYESLGMAAQPRDRPPIREIAREKNRSVDELIDLWVKKKKQRMKIGQAHAFAERWGAAGIFFSRWLVTPLGPWINLTSGMTGYSWRRFFAWDVLGEVLWVVLYVMLGKFFSGRVQALLDILGNLAWVIVGLIAATILGWQILRSTRATETVEEPIHERSLEPLH